MQAFLHPTTHYLRTQVRAPFIVVHMHLAGELQRSMFRFAESIA
jgi:hypothetical protein